MALFTQEQLARGETPKSGDILVSKDAVEVNLDQQYFTTRDSKGNIKYHYATANGGASKSTNSPSTSESDARKDLVANTGVTPLAGPAFFSNPQEADQLRQTQQFFAPNSTGGLTEGLNGVSAQDRVAAMAKERGLTTAAEDALTADTPNGNGQDVSMVQGGQMVDGEFQQNPNYTPNAQKKSGLVQTQNGMGGVGVSPQSQPQAQEQAAIQSMPVQRQLTQEDYFLKQGETPQQYNDRIARLRGETIDEAPATQTTFSAFEGQKQKFGIQNTQEDFQSDPINTIKSLTKQVLTAMGYDQATSEYTKVTKELEDLENKKDDEIRNINDNPWLTEGVRLRQIQKAEEKYEDKIGNRINTLQLLDNIRDDARQQSQFAVGTAISMWDNERAFQQKQQQMAYDQSQREFDNAAKIYELNQRANAQEEQPNSVKEWLFAVENGEKRSYGEWANPTKAVSGSGTGGSSAGTSGSAPGGIISTATGKPLKLTATQADTVAGFTNTANSATNALALLNQGVQTGPVQGSLLQGKKMINKADPNQLKLEQVLGKLKADFMKALSGAAVSDAEVIRLSKFLPDIYDQESVITSKLNNLIEESNRSLNTYLGIIGGTTSQQNSTPGQTSSGLKYTITQ